MKHGTPPQANRGPKNPGRSVNRALLRRSLARFLEPDTYSDFYIKQI